MKKAEQHAKFDQEINDGIRCKLCGCKLRKGEVTFCDGECRSEYARLNPPRVYNIYPEEVDQ